MVGLIGRRPGRSDQERALSKEGCVGSQVLRIKKHSISDVSVAQAFSSIAAGKTCWIEIPGVLFFKVMRIGSFDKWVQCLKQVVVFRVMAKKPDVSWARARSSTMLGICRRCPLSQRFQCDLSCISLLFNLVRFSKSRSPYSQYYEYFYLKGLTMLSVSKATIFRRNGSAREQTHCKTFYRTLDFLLESSEFIIN